MFLRRKIFVFIFFAFFSNFCGEKTNTSLPQSDSKDIDIQKEIQNFLLGPPKIRKAGNCEIVKTYILNLLRFHEKRMKNVDLGVNRRFNGIVQEGRDMLSFAGGDNIGFQPQPDFSQTNVLEYGIDEADLVKTDGKFIYFVGGGNLKVIRAYPPDNMSLLTQTQTYGTEILLLKDKVFSFSGRGEWYWWFPEIYLHLANSIIEKFNFDSSRLILRESLSVEGMYDSARLLNGKIYLVGTSYIKRMEFMNYLRRITQSEQIEDIVIGKEFDYRGFLPKVMHVRFEGRTMMIDEEPIADCENIFISSVTRGTGIVWIFVDDGDNLKKYAILGVSGLITRPFVYMSHTALYILFSDAEWITTDEGISAKRPKTVIYKFRILEDGELDFVAGTEIDGMIPANWWMGKNSLFSINEYNGLLRLVLTTRVWGVPQSEQDNIIVVFDSNLRKVGELKNLKPDEDIYAVRFVEKIGYVVTFRRIDPLFIIDLSDPENPKIAGKLEVPGFSTYLHPVSEGKVFAVGREGGNLQVSLFDVSDPQHPSLLTRINLSGDWSEAELNYKAITFFKDLIAFPFSSYSYSYSGCDSESKYISGLVLLKVFGNELNLVGKFSPNEFCQNSKKERKTFVSSCIYTYIFCPQFLRSVFIDKFIYGITDSGVKVWRYDGSEDKVVDFSNLRW